MRKTENLDNLRVFCTIVKSGSVRAASMQLNTETSNAFRTVRQLESELGVQLFDRKARPMKLTRQGEQFYEYSRRLLKLHREMLSEIRDDTESLSGRIRISSTAGFRQAFLTPALVEFQMENPNIVLDLKEMTTGVSDVLGAASERGSDIALTYMPKDGVPAGVEVRECGEMPFISCTSSVYLKRYGAPASPAECANHIGVLLALPNRSSVSFLSKDGVTEKLSWRRTMSFNSQINARDAMLLGAGIIPDLAFYFATKGIRNGQIVQVMPGWTIPTRIGCLFATESAYRKKRVRFFMDWLEKRFTRILDETCAAYRDFIR